MTEQSLDANSSAQQPALAVLIGALLGAMAFALSAFLFGATFAILVAAFAVARTVMRGKRVPAAAFAFAGVACAFAFHGSTVAVLLGAFCFMTGLALVYEPLASPKSSDRASVSKE